jgi:GAF domain-containing protein
MAALLKTFARTLVTDYPIEQLLDRLCTDIAEILEVDGAGVMLEDEGGALRFVAASDATVRHIEALQIELDEGPCRHAYDTGEVTQIADLEHDKRFPHFSPRAVAVGMASVQSYPLKTDDQCVGALNVYSAQPAAFDDEDAETGMLLADIATTYIINSRTLRESYKVAGQLQRALDSRVVIEQAKGKLSEQLAVSVKDAFEIMRTHARNNGRKLHDIAAEVVEGTLKLDGPA